MNFKDPAAAPLQGLFISSDKFQQQIKRQGKT